VEEVITVSLCLSKKKAGHRCPAFS